MTTDFDRTVNRRGTDSVKWGWYGDAIPMWVADMDFLAPEPVIAALQKRVSHGVFGYANEPPQLREVMRDWLIRRFNWRVPADALVFTPGVVTAFNVASRAFCSPGDGVLVQAPVYPPMRTAPANFGMVRDEMELARGPDGRYFVDYDLMNTTITARTKLFMLCNPHNPTGRVFGRDELLRVAEVSLAKGLVICSDEIHCDLVYAPYKHLPIASLDPEIARRTVTVMAPSKTFNIPGLGFSFAIIEDPDLRKQYKAAGRDIVPHINVMGYTAALAAYTECDPWLSECIAYLQANRDFLAQFVAERLPGAQMALPEATYLAWLDFKAAELGEDPFRFFLERAGVALNEGAPFGPGSDGFARLNFGCPRSQLIEALERMEKAMKAAGVGGPNV